MFYPQSYRFSAAMNTTEAGLLKQLGEVLEKLMNYHNVAAVAGVLVGKQLRTMGSVHLRNKLESEFRKPRGWEKAFQQDMKEMMDIPDDDFYTTGRLDKEAEDTAVSIHNDK